MHLSYRNLVFMHLRAASERRVAEKSENER